MFPTVGSFFLSSECACLVPTSSLRPYRLARHQVRDADLLLFRRRGLISIAGRGDHSHAAKAAWWSDDFADWRPVQWNQLPPQATALELIDEALYSAEEAAMFLQGFNTLMLDHDRPIWAVAVRVTLRYEGDAQCGMSVQGHAFARESSASDEMEPGGNSPPAGSPVTGPVPCGDTEAARDPLQRDHFHGFGQSPQRSR